MDGLVDNCDKFLGFNNNISSVKSKIASLMNAVLIAIYAFMFFILNGDKYIFLLFKILW